MAAPRRPAAARRPVHKRWGHVCARGAARARGRLCCCRADVQAAAALLAAPDARLLPCSTAQEGCGMRAASPPAGSAARAPPPSRRPLHALEPEDRQQVLVQQQHSDVAAIPACPERAREPAKGAAGSRRRSTGTALRAGGGGGQVPRRRGRRGQVGAAGPPAAARSPAQDDHERGEPAAAAHCVRQQPCSSGRRGAGAGRLVGGAAIAGAPSAALRLLPTALLLLGAGHSDGSESYG